MKRAPLPTPRTKARRLIAGLAGMLLLAAVGTYYWRAVTRTETARRAATEEPDLQGANPELIDRIRDTRGQILRGNRPLENLATLLRLYYANGWFEAAGRVCTTLIELDPRNPEWSHVLGVLRANAGQLAESIPLFARAIKLAPDYLPSRLKAAAALAKLNRVEDAVVMYEQVLVVEATNPYALVGLGNIQLGQQRWPAALACFDKAIKAAPQFRPAWLGLVAVHEGTGNITAAADAHRNVEAISRSPDSPDPWIDTMQEECYNVYYLRVAAFSSPDLAFALKLLRRAVALQPRDAAAHKDLGLSLYRANSLREARIHLTEATALAPRDSDTWLSLVTFLTDSKDQTGAAQAIEAGLSHCPRSPGLWLERGRMLQRSRAFDAALAALAKAVEFGPNEAAPRVERAVILFQLGRDESALTEVNAALALQPDHPFALVVMTRYAIVTGDKATAQRFWDKTRRNPGVMAHDRSQLTAAFQSAFGSPPQ
jgi:Flp pilus assembly protein TadD